MAPACLPMLRQEISDFVERESRLLGGDDDFEDLPGLARVLAIAVQPPIDRADQAQRLIITDTRGRQSRVFRQFADLHPCASFALDIKVNFNLRTVPPSIEKLSCPRSKPSRFPMEPHFPTASPRRRWRKTWPMPSTRLRLHSCNSIRHGPTVAPA